MLAVARGIVESLKGHPLALVLVVVNVLFLAGGAYGLREISASAARRDALLANCIVKVPK